MPEYAGTRARYLTWVMVGYAGINASILLENGVPAARLELRLAVALLMLSLAAIWRRRAWPTVPVARAVLLGTWALTTLEGATWAQSGFPAYLVFLPTYSVIGTLLVSPTFGIGLTALNLLAITAALRWHGAAWDDYSIRNLSNLVIVQVGLQALALTVVQRLNRAARSLEASQLSLELLRAQVDELSKTLFRDVAHGLDRLGSALQRDVADGVALAVDEIQGCIARCRQSLPSEPDTRDTDEALVRMEGIRHSMVGWFIGLGCFMTVALQARDLVLSNPRWGYTPVLLALNLVSLTIHARRPRWDHYLIWFAAIPSYLIFALLYWLWAGHHPGIPPNLAFAGYFLIGAPLAGGPALSATVAAVSAGLILGRSALDPAALVVAPLAYLGMAALCSLGLWRLSHDLTRVLRAQVATQLDAVHRRQRLVATLFHDLVNPLQAIMTLHFMEPEIRSADDRSRIERMAARMRQVIDSAWRLAEDKPITMGPVSAAKIATELEELFRDRLARKGIIMAITMPAGLTLLGDEALLRDSILGNLVSNAIKFSPPGGRIELTATAADGVIGFAVHDQGPGVPAGVLATLAKGLTSASSPGSQGETGHGYGLSLARGYLRRMGGELAMEKGLAGGTIAKASGLTVL